MSASIEKWILSLFITFGFESESFHPAMGFLSGMTGFQKQPEFYFQRRSIYTTNIPKSRKKYKYF